jgi:hypothetical protein
MDFLNQSRELFRQALTEAIRNHIPENLRLPFALALVLMGSCYAITGEVFRGIRTRPAESRLLSPENFKLYVRSIGVLMLIAAGVLLKFG